MASESVPPVPAGFHPVTPWIVISDSAYERAMAAGATSATEPRKHAWGNRAARVRDHELSSRR